MALTLKDLAAGQQRLAQREAEPLRISTEQLAAFAKSLQAAGNVGAKTEARIFEEFVKQTQRREELLKDATEEQKTIFKELEDSINKLRSGNHDDSVQLRSSIATLTRKLAGTAPTAAKSKMLAMATPPAVSKNTFATQLSPTDYKLFEGAGTAGSVAKPPATATGTAEPKGGGIMDTLLGSLGGLILTGFGKIIKAIGGLITGKGIMNEVGDVLDDTGPVGAPGSDREDGKKKTKKGTPKAKPKNVIRGKLFGGLGGLVGGMALGAGADVAKEKGYTETGAGLDTAGNVLAYGGLGQMAGMGIGAGIGALFGGVGAVPGAAIGAGLGRIAGSAYGLYEGVKKNYFEGNEGFWRGEAGWREKPKDTSTEMRKVMMENQNLIDQNAQPAPVIVNQQPAIKPADTTPMIFAPGPSVRPSENALENWLMRGFHAT